MTWKDDNGNTCYGIKPDPALTAATASPIDEPEPKTPARRGRKAVSKEKEK